MKTRRGARAITRAGGQAMKRARTTGPGRTKAGTPAGARRSGRSGPATNAEPATYAVVLAGGGGTRLWPSSRRARPKQLLRLGGSEESLLAGTVRRIAPVFGHQRILVVTARDQERAIRRELPQLPAENVLVEPAPRNTAGAIAIAAAFAHARGGPQAVLAVLPADHHIGDEEAFRGCIRLALPHATETIVTIGVQPTAPETGYGYIRAGRPVVGGAPKRDGGAGADGGSSVCEVAAFVEKPDAAKAAEYLRAGDYLWNCGMFFLTAGRMLAEAERHLPRLHGLMADLVAVGQQPRRMRALLERRYPDVEAISIDYGVMERAAGIRVVKGAFGWSDVGSWSALADIARHSGNRDEQENVLVGDVLVRDGQRNIVVSDPGAPFVGVVGVTDLVVVATPDGVLVVPRERAQDVRQVVDALKNARRGDLLDRPPGPPLRRSAAVRTGGPPISRARRRRA